jgi:hypothetical protein
MESRGPILAISGARLVLLCSRSGDGVAYRLLVYRVYRCAIPVRYQVRYTVPTQISRRRGDSRRFLSQNAIRPQSLNEC